MQLKRAAEAVQKGYLAGLASSASSNLDHADFAVTKKEGPPEEKDGQETAKKPFPLKDDARVAETTSDQQI